MISAWLIFLLLVTIVLVINGMIPQSIAGSPSLRRAVGLCLPPIMLAFVYGLYLHYIYMPSSTPSSTAGHPLSTFNTGYLLELSLSADNVMLFVVLLRVLKIPAADHGVVMLWAVLLALAARVALILTGLVLLARFHILFYVMGVFLLLLGILMFFRHSGERRAVARFMDLFSHWMPVSPAPSGRQRLITFKGRRYISPLLLAIVLVGVVDVLFAFDSIPAVFGITTDPLIITSSNVFAVLAMNRLYFIITPLLDRWRFFETGLAFILLFIGSKMLLPLLPISKTAIHISTTASLWIILIILLLAVGASLILPNYKQ